MSVFVLLEQPSEDVECIEDQLVGVFDTLGKAIAKANENYSIKDLEVTEKDNKWLLEDDDGEIWYAIVQLNVT